MARPSYPWFRESKGTWYVTVNGRKVSLGVRGRENERAALDAWHKLMAGAEPVPTNPAPSPTPAAGSAVPTVASVVKAFLADAEERVKPNTARGYRDFLEPFAKRFGHLPVSELTEPAVEGFARKPRWSPSTRHDFIGTVATAFRWAVRAKLVSANPVPDLRRPPKESRGESALITPDEFAKLLEAAAPQFKPFLEVLHLTGARPGEVASITAENFDAGAGLVRLAQHKTRHKTGKPRVIHLPPRAVEILKTQRERYPSGPLLRNRSGKPWTTWAVVKATVAARGRAGIRRAVTAYSFRHTVATDMLAAGVPDAIAAELLGHKGTAMLHKHYAHLVCRARELREALSRVRS